MTTPPTVAGIKPEEVKGDIGRLLPPLERALRGSEDCLRAGITLRDNVQAHIREVAFTVPDDWVDVTLLNGWGLYGATQFGTPGVRKGEDGMVEARGAIARGAGAPAANSNVFALPAGYEPGAAGDRRFLVENLGAVSGLEVVPAGFIQYTFGAVTFMDLSGCRWLAGDRRPAPWSTPLVVEVPVQWTPAYVRVLSARYAGEKLRQWTGGGPVLWSASKVRAGVHRVEIQRIMGLEPTQAHSLTIGVFPE